MQLGEMLAMLNDLVVFSDSAAATRWLNNAYKKLAYEARVIAATADTVSLVADQQEYDYPDDCYSDGIIWVAFDDERKPFLTMTELAKIDENWQTETAAEPDYWYTRGRKYGFYPLPSANDSNAITVYYYQMPDDLNGGDSPTLLDDDLHDYIVFGAAHIAALYSSDNRATYFKGLFDEGMLEARKRGARSHSGAILPLEWW